ncbi:MAG TPA: PRC-barrel domain containing protein [Paraburkholderia sp.]|jgi:hypothetical protein
MSGGFLRPVFRLLLLAVLAALALSGCSLFGPQQQSPAPITEAVSSTVEPPPPPPVVEAEPEDNEPAGPSQPKKPKRVIVRPHKVEPPPPAPAPAPPPPPPAPLIVTRTIERSAARGVLDAEVQKPDGKVIGRAVDLTADGAGTPRELIVNLQGFMGIGDRKASFPWNAFRFTPAARSAPITITMPPAQMAAVTRSKPSASLATPLAGVAAAPAVPPGQLALLDATVERPNGAKVGRVIDVLIDGNAQPQAVVLDVSGIINLDRRAIAANWSALHLVFVAKDKTLHAQMDLNEAQIKASPSYESGKPIIAVSPAPPQVPAAAAAVPPGAASAPAAAASPAAPAASTATPASSSASSAAASAARTSR